MSTELRPELEKLPERMQDLPIDRGYPVPWFVDWINNEAGDLVPEFRAMDPRKFVRAVKEKLCWVCGKRLGAYIVFAIGPMCGINRISSEPPCHLECAEWSAKNCPFLSRPKMVRREMDEKLCPQKGAGFMIERNPGVMLLWVTRDYEITRPVAGNDGYLFNIGNPVALTFWCEGRAATRAEIDESVRTGLPFLEAVVGPGERPIFDRMYQVFQELLPAA